MELTVFRQSYPDFEFYSPTQGKIFYDIFIAVTSSYGFIEIFANSNIVLAIGRNENNRSKTIFFSDRILIVIEMGEVDFIGKSAYNSFTAGDYLSQIFGQCSYMVNLLRQYSNQTEEFFLTFGERILHFTLGAFEEKYEDLQYQPIDFYQKTVSNRKIKDNLELLVLCQIIGHEVGHIKYKSATFKDDAFRDLATFGLERMKSEFGLSEGQIQSGFDSKHMLDMEEETPINENLAYELSRAVNNKQGVLDEELYCDLNAMEFVFKACRLLRVDHTKSYFFTAYLSQISTQTALVFHNFIKVITCENADNIPTVISDGKLLYSRAIFFSDIVNEFFTIYRVPFIMMEEYDRKKWFFQKSKPFDDFYMISRQHTLPYIQEDSAGRGLMTAVPRHVDDIASMCFQDLVRSN
ncbi:MAG: hypothetical protein COB78_12730 [Hyphomicrobiales bacterium]|nr:MAG: hypothetical protein COB78_12730 [Hyphomicrobiales bacterium]